MTAEAHPKLLEPKLELADRIARKIVEIVKDTGECTLQDLLCQGFAPDDLNRALPLARGMAAATLNPRPARN